MTTFAADRSRSTRTPFANRIFAYAMFAAALLTVSWVVFGLI